MGRSVEIGGPLGERPKQNGSCFWVLIRVYPSSLGFMSINVVNNISIVWSVVLNGPLYVFKLNVYRV